jgi:hypothetical protein
MNLNRFNGRDTLHDPQARLQNFTQQNFAQQNNLDNQSRFQRSELLEIDKRPQNFAQQNNNQTRSMYAQENTNPSQNYKPDPNGLLYHPSQLENPMTKQ